MRTVVLTAAVRTAIGGFGGTLKSVPPVELAKIVINSALARAECDSSHIDKVIFGNCFAPLDLNIARIAAYNAGVPETVPAFSIDSTCGSSMQALICGVQAIQTEDADLVMAGGVESMSTAPYIMESARWGQRIRDATVADLLWRGMQEYPIGVGMGLTAENLAEQYGIQRDEQDRFALLSHQRAATAVSKRRFDAEIVPVPVQKSRKETVLFDTDEHIRADLTIEKLAALPAAFKKGGTVTAGNACGMNDAAASVILTTEDKAKELGVKPLAAVRSYYVAGVDPHIMGIGPVPSIRGALARAGLDLSEVDRFEINEAFAAQYLACERDLGLDRDKVNVNGGGIALGHPVGATGCRLVVSLVHQMLAQQLRIGVASLCAGGGMGFSFVIELIP